MSQTAGFNVAGDGDLSNDPTAVNGTCPFGKSCADAVEGVTATESKCRCGFPAQATIADMVKTSKVALSLIMCTS